jgi:serine/threonine protein kinase
LGEGKFGKVKVAIHKRRKVAIKIIKKSAANAEEMGLIRSEIEILKICQHPSIIRLLDVFENIDHLFLVTELLTAGNLQTYS